MNLIARAWTNVGIGLKGWRTIIINVLMSIIPFLELTEFKVLLPVNWLPYYALFIVAANLYLRKITTTPIGRGE